MSGAGGTAQPTRAPRAVPRRRLAMRLAWITTSIVLLTQAAFVVPVLVRLRDQWLDRRLTEAELAAVSARVAANGVVDAAARDALLRLAGVESIVLLRPGQPIAILAPSAAPAPQRRVDLGRESLLDALASTFASLLHDRDEPIAVEQASVLQPDATIVATVRGRDLHRMLVATMLRLGTIRLCIAIAIGAALYALLMVLLVRPIQRLAESIAAFRADPERSAPMDEARIANGRGDEVATAARELAAMQRELRAALWRNARLAALGAAMAKVNHDLRGILSPAMLTAERLQMHPDPSVRRAGDVLVRAVERAANLARRTLEFARDTPVSPPRERIALRPAVEDAAEQARAACPALLVANLVAPEIDVDADRESLVRVLGNLLRNAAEAEATRVSIAAAHEGEELAITVADDGPGLPDAVRAALFRPFVAGGRRGSTGLGLAIVHDLIRAHGGDVALLDSGPTGTRFRLTLPRRGIPASAPAAAAAG
jgi:signal transduction histidine kinase